jgi:hypothetical protein
VQQQAGLTASHHANEELVTVSSAHEGHTLRTIALSAHDEPLVVGVVVVVVAVESG